MTDEPLAQDEAAEARKPPYHGFGAFHSFVERLSKSGVPAVVDRQFIGGSGTNQSQMTGVLTFLGLIDEESKPTQDLHDLAEKEDQRPDIYRRLAERHYAGALMLGNRATQSQLDQWFRQQGVNGETARKAESFFVSLAKAGGLEVSPHFKPNSRSTPTMSARKKTTGRRRGVEHQPPPADVPPPPSPAQARIHPTVMNVLDKIPAPGEPWTQKERDLLVTTFGHLLDLFHPVKDPGSDSKKEAPKT
jgi:hypothetical protein